MTIHILKKYSEKLMLVCLLLISIYTVGQSFRAHQKFIDYPYQVEYREGAVLAVTDLYLKGENPYDIKFQPEHTYNYGFLYPLTTSIFAAYTGNNLAVHRWVTYCFILLTCLLLFLTLRRIGVNIFLSLTASVLLHQTLLYFGLSSIARPEGLGIFLFVAGILLPWRFNFSNLSCFVSVVLGLLGYLAKPYYAFVIPAVVLYLFLFVSKKKAFVYGLFAAMLFPFMIYLVNAKYETFFNNTFFVHSNYSDYSFRYMLSQLVFYCKVNAVIILIAILSASILFAVVSKSLNGTGAVLRHYRDKIISVNFKKFNTPVFETSKNLLFMFIFLTSVAIFAIYLGGNTGSDNAAYLFHLSSPFLILAAFQLANRVNNFLFNTVVIMLLAIVLLTQFKPKMSGYVKQMDINRKAAELISGKENILNSAETVSIIIDNSKKLYNSGHTEYFQYGAGRLSKELGVSENTERKNTEYKNNLNMQIANKNFDLVLISETVSSYFQFIDKTNLVQHYQCADTILGPLSRIEVWLPLDK